MNQAPYKAVFIDLDGTLLPIDTSAFMSKYRRALSSFVASHGLDVDVFTKGLYLGINEMATHEDGRSNADTFWDAFFGVVPEDPEVWKPLFESFYQNEFNEIGRDMVSNPYAAQSISILRKKGYPLVLATMPMFPLQAVKWRIEWAGVDPQVFSRISSFENSTSVKPKLVYFEELLRAGGLTPEEVLMVGNNTDDDLACLQLGMDAYLITDFLINDNDFDLSTVKHGSYADFVAWVKGLAPCENLSHQFETGLVG